MSDRRVRGDIEWPERLTFEGGEMYLDQPRMTEAIYRPVTHDPGSGKVCLFMLKESGHNSWWRLLNDSYKGPTVSMDRWPDDAHKFRWTLSHALSNAEWNDAISHGTLVVSSEGVDLDADPSGLDAGASDVGAKERATPPPPGNGRTLGTPVFSTACCAC